MKSRLFGYAVIAVAAMGGGCDSDPDTKIVFDTECEYIVKNGLDIDPDGTDESFGFTVYGDGAPRIEIKESPEYDSQWLRASCRVENGHGVLGISCSENEGFDKRTARINVRIGDGAFGIDVSQKAFPHAETTLGAVTVVECKASKKDITFRANGTLRISFNYDTPGWVEHTQRQDGDQTVVSLDFSENTGLGRVAVMNTEVDGKRVATYLFRQLPAEFGETVDVPNIDPGELPVLLGDDMTNLGRIRNLWLQGTVNSLDLHFLRSLGSNDTDNPLAIDMADTRIVAGRECHYKALTPENIGDIPMGHNNELPDYQFEDFHNLTSLRLPETLETIGSGCFRNCISLAYLKIPESVTTIWHSPFAGCKAMKEIEVGEESMLTTIYDGSFTTPGRLHRLELPASLVNIEGEAFFGCKTDSLFLHWDKPPIVKVTPRYRGCILFVPEGTADLYRTAPGWNKFETIKEF